VEVRTTSSRVLRLAGELRKQASGEERLFFAVELVAEGVLEWKYGLRLRESYVSLESCCRNLTTTTKREDLYPSLARCHGTWHGCLPAWGRNKVIVNGLNTDYIKSRLIELAVVYMERRNRIVVYSHELRRSLTLIFFKPISNPALT
jgi:hypothetical protein